MLPGIEGDQIILERNQLEDEMHELREILGNSANAIIKIGEPVTSFVHVDSKTHPGLERPDRSFYTVRFENGSAVFADVELTPDGKRFNGAIFKNPDDVVSIINPLKRSSFQKLELADAPFEQLVASYRRDEFAFASRGGPVRRYPAPPTATKSA